MSYEPRIVFKTAGYNHRDEMWFEPGPSRCGDIKDGVALGHYGDDGRFLGGFVLAFADLERMYTEAKRLRVEALLAAARGE